MGIKTTAVNMVLEELAYKEEQRFNAHQIAFLSGQRDIEEVNEYLLHLSQGKFASLIAKIEVLCEANDHPDAKYNLNEPLPSHEICYICGDEYVPTIERSHLVFYFEDSYIQEVKKKGPGSQGDDNGVELELPEMREFMYIPDLIRKGTLAIEPEFKGGFLVTVNHNYGNTHQYGAIDARGNKGNIGLGENVTITQILNENTEIANLTRELLNQLQNANLPTQQRTEIIEVVNAATEVANAEEPNKTILKSLVQSGKGLIAAATTSTALIEAYNQWSTFIGSM